MHPGNSALFSVMFPLYFWYFKVLIKKKETRGKNITVRTNFLTYRLKSLAIKNKNIIIEWLACSYLFSLDVRRTRNFIGVA